ncbi:hypothetical protein PROFUN_13900 [Planoprotostelium fungivorum]|uniref:DUF6259 domain-containing protein n=1 Tax=Planoprotostelium fungivorum TaxID=1890364 RepID=A0A2P6N2T6_9EUKA|nr:hypothetical protein PROFUN_13900 [Planoprotostelium fungivorum]
MRMQWYLLLLLAVLTAGQKTLSLRRSPEATDIVETHKDIPFTTQFSSQDGTSVRLSNDLVSYTFASAAQGFGLLSMLEPSSRIEHILSSNVSPFLWNAEWRDADGLGYQTTNLSPAFKSSSKEQNEEGEVLTLRWDNLTMGNFWGAPQLAISIIATIELPTNSSIAYFSVRIDHRTEPVGDPCLWSLDYPIIQNIGRPSDVVIFPRGFGIRINTNSANRLQYPGETNYQAISQCDGKTRSCVYFAAQDPSGHYKTINYVEREMYVGHIPGDTCVKRGGGVKPDYSSPWRTALGVHSGDWWDASQIYRRWALSEADWTKKGRVVDRTDIPNWHKEATLWFNTGWDSGVLNSTEGDPLVAVPKLLKLREIIGADFSLHYYCWHHFPFDSNYPDYFPAKTGWTEGVQKLKEAGVKVLPYINGRLWDYNSPSFTKEEATPHLTKSAAPRFNPRTVQPSLENYGSGQNFAVACPHTTYWQNKISSVVDTLFQENSISGIYIDQIAAATSVACADAEHGHSTRGGDYFVKGAARELDLAQEAASRVGGIIVSESNSEPFMSSLSGFLSLVAYDSCDSVPFFVSSYSDYSITFGRIFLEIDATVPSGFNTKMAEMFLLGSQLGWAGVGGFNPFYSFLLDERNAASLNFLRNLMEISSTHKKYFRDGRLMPKPSITSSKAVIIDTGCKRPAIDVAAWKSGEDESLSVFITNANVMDDDVIAVRVDLKRLEMEGERFSVTVKMGEKNETSILQGTELKMKMDMPRVSIAVITVTPLK